MVRKNNQIKHKHVHLYFTLSRKKCEREKKKQREREGEKEIAFIIEINADIYLDFSYRLGFLSHRWLDSK